MKPTPISNASILSSIRSWITAVLALTATIAAAGETDFRGSISRAPAGRWEDAFVTGNGRMGAMLFGQPADDTLVVNHCRLFLPLGNREIVPDLAQYLPELRRIIHDKGYGQAMNFLLSKARQQGYPGLIPTDPCHPGLFVNIRQPAVGAVKDYERRENFQTGEVTVRWRDDRGQFQRRLFVSRTDNLVALSLTGPVPCELAFPAVGHPLIQSQQQTTPEWVTYHNIYTKGKGGYDAAVRVIRKDEGRDVLLLVRIVPWKTPLAKEHSEAWAYSPENADFTHPDIFVPVPPSADSSVVAYRAADDAKALLPRLKESLAAVAPDYARLLVPHAKAHGALFNRVTLDLGGGADRAKTTEELLDLAKKENCLPAALTEKMYDAGRYMLICCAGELLPNLQGIWTGSWTPAWSGDFTLDTNVQSAMASACSANLPELMEGYFRTMESFYPEWRLNAKRIYGCRGFFTNARASNTALELHWGDWDGIFWTAGCGWLGNFFTHYAEYTGDREFLAHRCVPMLKEIAVFYEDFLHETDKDGRMVFIPSYSPEVGGGIDATMDIAVARGTLMKLIAACRELNIESENIPRWEKLLGKLPDYSINDEGHVADFPRWKLCAGHRHHSPLYPCFQSFDPLFETDAALRAAAQATVRAKIAASDRAGKDDEQSSFGRMQAGVAAAYLGLAEEAYGRLKVMAVKRSMNPSLITSHEPGASVFNTDGNGGIPQILDTMLVFSRPGRIDLLPALPKEWPDGKVTGLLACGGLIVDIEWKSGKVTNYRIASAKPCEVKVRVNGETKTATSGQLCVATALAARAADTVTVRPTRDDTMLLNPGKGWVEYYGTSKYTDDMISVGYTRPTWAVIEPQEGQFNWKPLDDFIGWFKAHGKKVAFGVINFDGGMGRTYSIPKWVFDDGAVPFAAPDDSTPTRTIILPRTWDDPVYLAKMKKFIAAFGKRYDGTPDIEWIDIRDYGNSGESNGDYGVLRNCSAACYKDNYLAPYISAFTRTQLIVPWGGWFDGVSPEPIFRWAVSKGVGMRRDGICSQWSKDGSETLFAYDHEPIIFEYGDDWPSMVGKGTSTPETLMKYIKAGKPNYLQFFPQFYHAYPEFCHMLGNQLGYHFILEQATIPKAISGGQAVSIDWTWLNDGVAYLYKPCQVAVALLDGKNHVVGKQWLAGCNPQTWKPEAATTETVTASLPSVPAGTYKLAIGLFLDRKDAGPAYRLGIQGRTPEGWYVLTESVDVNK